MAFDPSQYSKGLIAGVEQILKAAYEQGVQDGIDRIVQAARAPQDGGEVRVPDYKLAQEEIDEMAENAIRRAPRGLVPKIVGKMLGDHPGKIIAEYEQMKDKYDSRVSAKSIGNELRRHEGKKYRRNEEGEWFPMSGNKEAGDGRETNSPASDAQTQGGTYGAALDL